MGHVLLGSVSEMGRRLSLDIARALAEHFAGAFRPRTFERGHGLVGREWSNDDKVTLTGMIVLQVERRPGPWWPANTARRVRGYALFRYIRYNGLHRPDVTRDDETAAVAVVERATPLGTRYPEMVLQDEVVDPAGFQPSPTDPVAILPGPQIESA